MELATRQSGGKFVYGREGQEEGNLLAQCQVKDARGLNPLMRKMTGFFFFFCGQKQQLLDGQECEDFALLALEYRTLVNLHLQLSLVLLS